jgi:Zn-dependent oligopeptidase
MSRFDMLVHSAQVNEETVGEFLQQYNQMMLDFLNVIPLRDSKPYTSWLHMTTGYNAGYYGYLWADVFSKDVFARFKREGVRSASVGHDFRRFILEPCASQDAWTMLRNFLGRDANSDAFFSDLLAE